jgi:hypothetical protein
MTSNPTDRELVLQEYISIFKMTRAVTTVLGTALVATPFLFSPHQFVFVVCWIVAYGCYEVCTMAKNCQDLYKMPLILQRALIVMPPEELQSRITKDAPLAHRILPALLPNDFPNHFFPQ